ncbi:MAG: DUF2085 domain-containing protein [Chloroflexi bacterium]|nr:DUF2085 domain-containing protein [Chloroflexota bacterium]
MIQVTLYYLDQTGDADDVRSALNSLQEQIPHELLEIDVSADAALRERYGDRVPVVEVGSYTLNSPFSEVELQVALGAARDSASRTEAAGAVTSEAWGIRLNRGVRFFTRHWLAAFSLIVFLYAGLPFLAPTLMKVGATGPARVIYTLYSPFCHQFAFRSFFLYGPQVVYPRELAGTDLVSYGEATGKDEQDVIAARRYVGDETVGYKTALCERDIGIYVGILIAGLVYGIIRNRRSVKPLPLKFWFLLGIVPIALDGGTQLISQLGFFPFPPRESPPLLRTATGFLFGAMNVWMAYPHVDQAMIDTNKTTSTKLAVAEQRAKHISEPSK